MRLFESMALRQLLSFGLCWITCTSFYSDDVERLRPKFATEPTPWADSLLCELSLEEKIGQLFMVAAYSNKAYEHEREIEDLIKKQHIGGLVFFQGTPHKQFSLIQKFQKLANVPLLIGMDAQADSKLRLDSMARYPGAMMLGASAPEHAYNVGFSSGRELKTLGVHISFSPVLDVNTNLNNPANNSRFFGEDVVRVGQHGEAYFKGLRDAGIMAVGKHFPGYGDTHINAHRDIPIISRERSHFEAAEFLPFRRLIDAGIPGIMVANIYTPSLDSTPFLPASLSPKVVTKILREEMNFEGLVFTDALNMKGLTRYYKPGHADSQAFMAGNDVLLFPEDVKEAVSQIKNAIRKKRISEDELDERVGRILRAKEKLGLQKEIFKEYRSIKRIQSDKDNEWANRRANAAAITLLINKDSIIPFKHLNEKHLLSVAIGENPGVYPFQKALKSFGRVDVEYLPKKPTSFERELIYKQIESNTVVLVSIHSTKRSPTGNYGITNETLDFIEEIASKTPTILVSFGNPYALANLKSRNLSGLIIAYEEADYAQQYAAESIFGAIGLNAKLPVSIGQAFSVGDGLETKACNAFHYTIPEAVGLLSSDLDNVDSIAQFGISQQAYPGCQILISKGGNVIYHKAFGFHTYEAKSKVKLTDLYDLASITKVASTVASCMYLEDKGLFSVEKKLGDYLPELTKGTEYADIIIKEMLTHRAGLRSWIPFYQSTMSRGIPRYDVYSLGQSAMYPYRVAENFYIHKNYPDSVIQQILDTPLHKEKEYRYSDLGYYFLQLVIEEQTGVPLDRFVDSVFYSPMGLSTTGYIPQNRFSLDEIVPTEYDLAFRKQLVHGDVHDPGAAMNGGVGGHAGLFSNANDLAKIMQMFISGEYGGTRYLSDSVLNAYTECLYCKDPEVDNRRGLGFDKPVTDGDGGPTCSCISLASFGHTGFTGTIAWADPEQEIVYVFLSNRVYPDAQNKKLIKLGIRTEIMQAIYDANHNAIQIQ